MAGVEFRGRTSVGGIQAGGIELAGNRRQMKLEAAVNRVWLTLKMIERAIDRDAVFSEESDRFACRGSSPAAGKLLFAGRGSIRFDSVNHCGPLRVLVE